MSADDYVDLLSYDEGDHPKEEPDNNQVFENVLVWRETELALLIEFPDGSQDWFPKSQLDAGNEVYHEGDMGTLVISEWLARKREANAEIRRALSRNQQA